jgi:hypothetical protein
MRLLTPFLFLALLGSSMDASAIENNLFQLEKDNKVLRKHATRIDREKLERCKTCDKEETLSKFNYMERVVSKNNSTQYQKLVEETIFTEKFKKQCWNNATNKGIDFFFTVTPSGEATDIVWFPKDREINLASKCIKRHLEGLQFPEHDSTHYSWLAVSNIDRRFL